MLDPQQIYELRKALGMTAREFGAQVGVTWNTVFRWESGERFPNRRHNAKLLLLLKKLEETVEST